MSDQNLNLNFYNFPGGSPGTNYLAPLCLSHGKSKSTLYKGCGGDEIRFHVECLAQCQGHTKKTAHDNNIISQRYHNSLHYPRTQSGERGRGLNCFTVWGGGLWINLKVEFLIRCKWDFHENPILPLTAMRVHGQIQLYHLTCALKRHPLWSPSVKLMVERNESSRGSGLRRGQAGFQKRKSHPIVSHSL